MKCVINYKGKEFQTQEELKEYLKANDIRGVNLQRDITYTIDSSFTSGQQRDVTSSLAYQVWQESGKDVENFDALDINEVLTDFILEKASELPKSSPYLERFKEVGEMIPFFAQEVKKFYKSKGVIISELLVEDEDGNLFTENKLTLTTKDKASAQVRAFVSMIPEQARSEKGGTVLEKDNFLGMPKFVDENVMMNDIQNILTNMPNPTLKKMMDLLQEEGETKPHLRRVVDGLKERIENNEEEMVLNEKLRTSFFNVFANASIPYMTLITEELEEGGIRYRASTSDPSSQQEMLREEWYQNFKAKNGNDRGSVTFYQPGRLESIGATYTELVKDLEKLRKKERKGGKRNRITPSQVAGLKSRILQLFDLIGIEINANGLNNFLRKEHEDASAVQPLLAMMSSREMQGMFNQFSEITQLAKANDIAIVENKNPIQDNKIVTKLAKRHGEVLANLGEATVLGPEGNQYSIYTDPSLMSQLVNELNSDFEKAAGEIRSAPWGVNSRTLKWLEEDKKRKLALFIFNNFKSYDKGDQGTKVSKLSDIEAIIADINIHLLDDKTATYTGIAESDKNEQVGMKGGEFQKAGLVFDEKGGVTVGFDNATKILLLYLGDELARMRLIYENMYGSKKIDKSEYIQYLHTDANILRSYLFPEFNKKNEDGETLFEQLGLVETINGRKVPRIVTEETFKNPELKKAVRGAFVNAVQNDIALMNDLNIISIDPTGAARNIGIDVTVASRYNNIKEAIADYTLNSIIGSIEMTMLFHGDPAAFKPKTGKETGDPLDLFSDFKKRASFVTAGGTMSRVYGDVKATYTTSVTDEVIAPSDYFFPKEKDSEKRSINKALVDRMVKAFNMGKEKDEQLTAARITEWIKGYKDINIADAQAWITLDLYRQRMKSWAKWSDEHEDAYNRLKNGELLFEDVKLLAQPLKTVHVEPVLKHGHRVTHYHKQSEAVIIPGLFKALDEMQAANPNTDHFVTIDGKKVGASGITKINNGDQLVAEEMPTVQLKTKYVYLQQDLSAKGVKSTLVGTQLVKNLLAQILENGFYEVTFGGSTISMSGVEIVGEYHKVVAELSRIGKDELEQRFGYHLNGTTNKEKFNDFLMEVLSDELTNSDKALLDTGVTIDAMPAVRKKLENRIMAEVLKASVKLKQSGGAFIQMSSFGTLQDTFSLDKETKDGIIWFKDPKEGLSPMRLEEDKDGVLYTEKAQVLLAHTALLNLIGPKYKSMTPQEIKDAIDPSVLEGISYRIPNQATSSNDSFEIVGILPAHMGDTIIAYNEITAKTGSDFDIDKAFIVLPNIEYRDGKITRPRYQHEMTVEEAYEEKLKKDWLKSRRAKELFDELESPEKRKKIRILNELKFIAKKAKIKAKLAGITDVEEFTALASSELIEYADQIQKSVDYAIKEGVDLGDEFTLDETKTIKSALISIKKDLSTLNDTHKNAVIAKLKEEKILPSLEEFKSYPAIKRHTKAALQNYRLDLMQGLLTDPKTYPAAMASLDSPALKNAAKELYEQGEEFNENLHFFKGTTQRKIKVLFDQSKGLVGAVANQLSHHNSTQMEGLEHSEYLGIGKITKNGNSPVSSISDTEGNIVSNWLSLYMNAIVDAAKDPFIAAANINHYTAPVAFMLLRAGVPMTWVNAFIGQPILRRLVEKKNLDESKIAGKVYDKKGRRLLGEDQLIKEVNQALEDSGVDTITDGFNAIKKNALRDIGKITEEDLKENINSPFASSVFDEATILAAFLKYKEKAKNLNNLIRASKSDVSIGKNLTEAFIKELDLAKVIADREILNVKNAFGIIEKDGQILDTSGYLNIDDTKMVGNFHKNAIQQANKMFANMSLMSSNAVRNTLFNVLFAVNPEKIHDSKAVEDVLNEIYSYIVSTELAGITNGDYKSLFFGKESTPRKMERFKRANLDFAQDNALLSDMTIIFKEDAAGIDYIKFRNKNQDRELYQQAWEELYEVNEELADELVKYSFHASGFNRNLFSFYQYIPTNSYIKKGFVEYMNKINLASAFPGLLGQKAEETIIKHLSENTKIIKTIPTQEMKPVAKGISTKKMFITKNSTDFGIGENDAGEIEFARYLRDSKSNLYALVGYYGKESAVYRQIPKLGFSSKGKVVKEYGVQTVLSNETQVDIFENSGTIFTENKVDPLNKQGKDAISIFKIIPTSEIVSTLEEGISKNLEDSFRQQRDNEDFKEALKRCDI